MTLQSTTILDPNHIRRETPVNYKLHEWWVKSKEMHVEDKLCRNKVKSCSCKKSGINTCIFLRTQYHHIKHENGSQASVCILIYFVNMNLRNSKPYLETARFCSKKSTASRSTTETTNFGTTIPFKIVIIWQFSSSWNVLLCKYPNPNFSQNSPLPCLTIRLTANKEKEKKKKTNDITLSSNKNKS